MTLPSVFTTILELDVPSGDYIVTGVVLVHNFSAPPDTLAVNCALGSPSEFSLPDGVRIDLFNSATAQVRVRRQFPSHSQRIWLLLAFSRCSAKRTTSVARRRLPHPATSWPSWSAVSRHK